MSRRKSFLGVCSLVLLLTFGSNAGAVNLALSFTGGSVFVAFDGTPQTIGWWFTVNSTPVVVSALGFWDQTPANPLSSAHQVGLWTDAGALLASTTVGVNDPLTGSFRFNSIASVTLAAGTYRLGGTISSADGDTYVQFASSVSTDPLITHMGDTRNDSNAGFSFPNIATTNSGRFGPNMLVTAVPEPTTLVLLGLGLAGAGAIHRRKRKV